MRFTQHIIVYTSDEEALLGLLNEDAAPPPPGLVGMRLHRFRDKPGRYMIQADFDSWESAQNSNERPGTQAWSDRLLALIDGEPKYEDLDVLLELTA